MHTLTDILSKLPDVETPVVSVLSGGLDSTIMTYILVEKYGADKVHALSFFYGQKQRAELMKASLTCDHLGISHKILDLSILGDITRDVCANIQGTEVTMPTIRDVIGDPQPKTYIPFRNMILNSFAFSFAESHGASIVFTGLQSTDEYAYWDTTEKFIRDMNQLASNNRMHQVRLLAPFASLSKADEIGISREIPHIRLEHTITCYNPSDTGISCGKCPSCAERIRGFMKNRMIDPIPYAIDIPWEV